MPETVEALEPTSAVEETATTTETPAAPESSAPSAPADEAAVTEPAASTSTRQRGPDGRFIKADGTQASEAEHAAIVAATPASPPVATTPAPPAPPASPGEPFVFRADGQRFPIPGSSVSPDGHLTIPAEQVPAVRQLLAEGVSHRGSWRTKEADYQRQIKESGAVQEAKAQKYNDAAVMLWQQINDPDWLARAVQDPRELEVLRDRLDIALQRADLKAPRVTEAPQPDPAQQQQQLESAAKQTLTEYVEELLETPQAKAIYSTPEEREQVRARYTRRMAAYFVDRGDEGIALHENAVDEDFNDEMTVRRASHQAALDAQKAHAFNAARNTPAVSAPPVVSTKGPGSTGATTGRVFKDRDEYRRAMGLS